MKICKHVIFFFSLIYFLVQNSLPQVATKGWAPAKEHITMKMEKGTQDSLNHSDFADG